MSQSDSGSGSPNITPSIDLLFPSNRSPPESSVSNETFSQFSPSIDLLFPANRSEPESSVSNETFSQFSPSIDLLFPANRSEPESSVSNETFSQFSSSIQTFFPPYRSPPESSVSNVTFSQFYPSIDLLFPANRSEPESSVSNEALQQLLSIPLIFPPTKSQSQTNSSENDNRIPNLFIDSIFPPTRSDSDSFTHKYTTALSITSYFPPLKLSSHDEATSLWWITGEREVSKREQPMSSSGPANSSGFTFTEANSVRASTSKVICCHFSSDGKVLASAGQDNKAVLWDTYSLKPKASLREHSALITDVRFSPGMPLLATSSLDGTVRVWDSDNPGYSYSLRTFTGHSNFVMSVDFHPNKDDLICSRDYNGEIRYWSFNNGSCVRVLKGGTDQMGFQIRFQPRLGRYLAVAEENVVSILDVETGQPCRHSLQGHTKPIHSVCWDPTGDFLASISEDSARVWQVGSGEGDCIHELICNGDQFHSCVFHPIYSSLLIIGCCQSLELWNISNNKTMTLPAHEGLVAALAVSTVTAVNDTVVNNTEETADFDYDYIDLQALLDEDTYMPTAT